MNSTTINLKFITLISLVILAAFSRLIPHMPNFSPLGAVALFSAAYFSKKWQALFIPIAAVWLSDLVINNVIYAEYNPTFTFFTEGFYWTYGSYILIALVGMQLFKKVTPSRVLGGALASTLIFFFVSNLGCYFFDPLYSSDFAGLVNCYIAGIPFVKATFLGDLFYATLLFGAYELFIQRALKLKAISNR
jgi:hypothetical protein